MAWNALIQEDDSSMLSLEVGKSEPGSLSPMKGVVSPLEGLQSPKTIVSENEREGNAGENALQALIILINVCPLNSAVNRAKNASVWSYPENYEDSRLKYPFAHERYFKYFYEKGKINANFNPPESALIKAVAFRSITVSPELKAQLLVIRDDADYIGAEVDEERIRMLCNDYYATIKASAEAELIANQAKTAGLAVYQSIQSFHPPKGCYKRWGLEEHEMTEEDHEAERHRIELLEIKSPSRRNKGGSRAGSRKFGQTPPQSPLHPPSGSTSRQGSPSKSHQRSHHHHNSDSEEEKSHGISHFSGKSHQPQPGAATAAEASGTASASAEVELATVIQSSRSTISAIGAVSARKENTTTIHEESSSEDEHVQHSSRQQRHHSQQHQHGHNRSRTASTVTIDEALHSDPNHAHPSHHTYHHVTSVSEGAEDQQHDQHHQHHGHGHAGATGEYHPHYYHPHHDDDHNHNHDHDHHSTGEHSHQHPHHIPHFQEAIHHYEGILPDHPALTPHHHHHPSHHPSTDSHDSHSIPSLKPLSPPKGATFKRPPAYLSGKSASKENRRLQQYVNSKREEIDLKRKTNAFPFNFGCTVKQDAPDGDGVGYSYRLFFYCLATDMCRKKGTYFEIDKGNWAHSEEIICTHLRLHHWQQMLQTGHV